MKRSNRLVLLVGVFLAIVAFILIAILLSQGSKQPGEGGATASPTTAKIVVAAQDIPLGATIQSADVTTVDKPIDVKPADSFSDPLQVVGKIARAKVTSGAYVSRAAIEGGGTIQDIQVPKGLVGIAVQVDQISGVGTIIKPGDYVDVVSGFTGNENVPLVIAVPAPSNQPGGAAFNYVKVDDSTYNHATVKVLAQGLQVLGTLLPPPPSSGNAQATPTPGPNAGGNNNTTTLNGQQQIVVLAATAQQSELIKFTQMSGSVTLVLRSPSDCAPLPEASPEASPSAQQSQLPCGLPVATSGITLRRIVDDWSVLPPQVVQVVVPSPLPGTAPRR